MKIRVPSSTFLSLLISPFLFQSATAENNTSAEQVDKSFNNENTFLDSWQSSRNLIMTERWVQRGNALIGDTSQEQLGYSVAISGNDYIAIGARYFSPNTNLYRAGKVSVFQKSSNDEWLPFGQELVGQTQGEWFGSSLSLSKNLVLAVGSPGASINYERDGIVSIWYYENGAWRPRGYKTPALTGLKSLDYLGNSVALSDDGSRLLVGAPCNANNGSGYAVVFTYDSSDNFYERKQTFEGKAIGDKTGYAVSISGDGQILAIGSFSHDKPKKNVGKVSIWKFMGSSKYYLTQEIIGQEVNEYLGFSVSLSGDGYTLAVGGNKYSGGRGLVKVYDESFVTGDFVEAGPTLVGSNKGDRFGYHVSLSESGDTLAVAAPFGGASNQGIASIYNRGDDDWVLVGIPIAGTKIGSSSSNAVALSANGFNLLVGSTDYDTKLSDVGIAKFYTLMVTSTPTIAFRSALSGNMCMEPAALAVGQSVVMRPCDGSIAQSWQRDSNFYYHNEENKSLCMMNKNGSLVLEKCDNVGKEGSFAYKPLTSQLISKNNSKLAIGTPKWTLSSGDALRVKEKNKGKSFGWDIL